MFTVDSGLVKIWVRQIQEGRRSIEEIPNIRNLQEIVTAVITAGE